MDMPPNQGPPPYAYQAAPPPRKSSLWKWVLGCGCLVVILGIAGIVAAVGGAAYFVSQSFTADPAKAKEIADGIVKFDVPKGYEMKFGMSMMGMKFAAFARPNEGDAGIFCIMMQVPKKLGMNTKQMEEQINKQAQEKGGQQEMKVESSTEQTIQIAGKDVKATKQVMVSKDGKTKSVFYQIVLDKPDAAVMIWAGGPEQGFDQEALDAFLRSLK